ncbi:hypothetical protein DIPPA_01548 [Diplonema papillatum]|nr:hypothetical protein DIPPA_01548 [Diplonema papillatum]|eukprot:gene6095-9357_t
MLLGGLRDVTPSRHSEQRKGRGDAAVKALQQCTDHVAKMKQIMTQPEEAVLRDNAVRASGSGQWEAYEGQRSPTVYRPPQPSVRRASIEQVEKERLNKRGSVGRDPQSLLERMQDLQEDKQRLTAALRRQRARQEREINDLRATVDTLKEGEAYLLSQHEAKLRELHAAKRDPSQFSPARLMSVVENICLEHAKLKGTVEHMQSQGATLPNSSPSMSYNSPVSHEAPVFASPRPPPYHNVARTPSPRAAQAAALRSLSASANVTPTRPEYLRLLSPSAAYSAVSLSPEASPLAESVHDKVAMHKSFLLRRLQDVNAQAFPPDQYPGLSRSVSPERYQPPYFG